MIFSSCPALSSMINTPIGRTLITQRRGEWSRVAHEHVDRVAVLGQRVRHEAVVAGIGHRRVEEAVDDEHPRGLVQLVLDRLAAERHLDDDVDVLGRVVADRNRLYTHYRGSSVSKVPAGVRRRAILADRRRPLPKGTARDRGRPDSTVAYYAEGVLSVPDALRRGRM